MFPVGGAEYGRDLQTPGGVAIGSVIGVDHHSAQGGEPAALICRQKSNFRLKCTNPIFAGSFLLVRICQTETGEILC